MECRNEILGEALARGLKPNGDDAGAVLRTFVVELLRLLLRERASIINWGAITEFSTDPNFARILGSRGGAAWF